MGTLHVAFLFSFSLPENKTKQKAVIKTMVILTIEDILELKKMASKISGVG